MALTRKFLKAMGIEEEKIEQIIDAHTETVDAIKEERDAMKKENEGYSAIKKELEELKSKEKDGYKEKYEKVNSEYEAFKNDILAKETKETKRRAYIEQVLKPAGISEKRFDSILKITDLESINLVDGKISSEDADKLTTSAKEEWNDFIVTTSTSGAMTPNPPANAGNKSTMTRAEIMAIKDEGERQSKIAENPQLFGIS